MEPTSLDQGWRISMVGKMAQTKEAQVIMEKKTKRFRLGLR